MLQLFLLAHVVVTVLLIHHLGVGSPAYQAIPWIFAAAYAAACVPQVERRIIQGGAFSRALPMLLYVGVISLASSTAPESRAPMSGNPYHPAEFAGLAWLGHYLAQGGLPQRLHRGRLLAVACGCVLFGVVDELHQSFVPGRDAAALDVVLDAVGTALGTGIFVALQRLSRRIGAETTDT